jgi:hypothetical protein
MSRTYRTSPDFTPKGAREGRGAMTCSGGRACIYCARGRVHSTAVREQAARAAIAAYWADPWGSMFPDGEPEWDDCSCCCCTGSCNPPEENDW